MLRNEFGAQSEKNKAMAIPKSLPGGVYPHSVLCKRTGVRYQYFRRQWREGGRLRKQYIKRHEIDAVRTACAENRRTRREWREAWAIYRKTVRELLRMGL